VLLLLKAPLVREGDFVFIRPAFNQIADAKVERILDTCKKIGENFRDNLIKSF